MAANSGYTTIKLRRGTTDSWTTGTKTLDTGEVGLDTTTGKIKFGTADGQAWASAKNVAVIQSDLATSVNGGAAGSVLYQNGANTTTFLDISGNANKSLVANGTGTAPIWVFPTVSTTYFSTTTSLQLQGVVTDAVGLGTSSSAKLVFNDSPVLTTPTISSGGAVFAQVSGGKKTTLVSQVTGADISVNLPTSAGTLALTTATNSFLKADGTVQGSANAYMTGTLAVGASGFSVTTTGNLATSGTVTFTNASLQSAGNGIVKINPSTGSLSAGVVSLSDATNVSGILPRGNGGLGVDPGADPIGTGISGARSTLRIFVQSTAPAVGNPQGYNPVAGDLWLW